ncbi:MAG: haloacid dehalogenase type II [Beijerinckiaceae bacterium]|nr:haloacid dehalogenase type II [Beijerinckiaceae bacterium]
MNNAPKALFFDVFGTLVDWRQGIARESEAILSSFGHSLDWCAFADDWRAQYQPTLEQVRSGKRAYEKLDALHRENVQPVLARHGVDASDAMLDALTNAWRRIPACPDTPAALIRLRERFLMAPVSNGNISMMAMLARFNDFHWDAVLGAELADDYKPNAEVYLTACAAFDLAPEQCVMVAAHTYDLKAAAALGLRTAHVARPNEYGPGKGEAAPGMVVDWAAADLTDLADQLCR